MAITQFFQYGLFFANPADAAAAIAANAGSPTLNMAPDTAISTFPLGTLIQYAAPYFSTVPAGTVSLGTYAPIFGTPGINWTPNTVSTATLTTAVAEVIYGSFLNVMLSVTVNFTWVGTITSTPIVLVPVTNPPFTGSWDQQVLTYAGDGNNGRLIPTTFPLNSGAVAIWIFAQIGEPIFRHNAMTGTTGVRTPSADTSGGIMSFTAGGFTVQDGSPTLANTVGVTYTAVIVRDSTSDNRYMKVGQYAGTADASLVISVGGTRQVTEVWLFARGGTGTFCSDDFSAGNSLSWADEGISLTNQITALGAGTFTIGNAVNVNQIGYTFYYAAFSIPAGTPASDPIRNHFQTFKSTGNGAPIVVALNFSPTFAIGAAFVFASPTTTWRGPIQTLTDSTSYLGIEFLSGGIEALGVNAVTIGVNTAPNTKDVYGYALRSAHVAGPPVVNTPPLGTPPPIPPGINIPYVTGGGYSLQWLMERFELKSRQEEHL